MFLRSQLKLFVNLMVHGDVVANKWSIYNNGCLLFLYWEIIPDSNKDFEHVYSGDIEMLTKYDMLILSGSHEITITADDISADIALSFMAGEQYFIHSEHPSYMVLDNTV